jgi:hypothetical protein
MRMDTLCLQLYAFFEQYVEAKPLKKIESEEAGKSESEGENLWIIRVGQHTIHLRPSVAEHVIKWI